jgi:hypothetical protein
MKVSAIMPVYNVEARAADGRTAWWIHPGACGHERRSLRAARPQGTLRQGPGGILKEFTGISDPYEEPRDAEVVILTVEVTPEEAAQEIVLHLERENFIGVNRASA